MLYKIVMILDKLNLISVAYANPSIENKPLNLVNNSSTSFNSGFSFTFIILLTILLLIGLVFVYFYISNKSMAQNQNMGEYLKVLERKRLGRDSFLYIIKLNNQGIVVAENSSSINTIMEIKDENLLKEIEVNTMNKFENLNFENFLKKESYKIENLKKRINIK